MSADAIVVGAIAIIWIGWPLHSVARDLGRLLAIVERNRRG